MREGPGPTSTSYALSPLRSGCGGNRRRWGGREKWRERELGLICKVKKTNLKNAFNDQSKNAQMQIFP